MNLKLNNSSLNFNFHKNLTLINYEKQPRVHNFLHFFYLNGKPLFSYSKRMYFFKNISKNEVSIKYCNLYVFLVKIKTSTRPVEIKTEGKSIGLPSMIVPYEANSFRQFKLTIHQQKQISTGNSKGLHFNIINFFFNFKLSSKKNNNKQLFIKEIVSIKKNIPYRNLTSPKIFRNRYDVSQNQTPRSHIKYNIWWKGNTIN